MDIKNSFFKAMDSSMKLQQFETFFETLVSSLPLEDGKFVAALNDHGLLPNDMKALMELMPTREAKTSYYLENLIKPELENNDQTSYDKLVAVMSNSEYNGLQQLATVMSTINNTEASKFNSYNFITVLP